MDVADTPSTTFKVGLGCRVANVLCANEVMATMCVNQWSVCVVQPFAGTGNRVDGKKKPVEQAPPPLKSHEVKR